MTQILTPADFKRLSHGYDREPQKSLSLTAETYVEPRWYQLDQQAIIGRSWQWVCHVEKLRQAGTYLATEIAKRSARSSRMAISNA